MQTNSSSKVQAVPGADGSADSSGSPCHNRCPVTLTINRGALRGQPHGPAPSCPAPLGAPEDISRNRPWSHSGQWWPQGPWGLSPHEIPACLPQSWLGAGHKDWLPHSSRPPGWDRAHTGLGMLDKPSAQPLCPSPQLSFTLLVRQKPIIKPLARGQSDNTARRCSAGRRGCRDLPFPHNTQHSAWMCARLAQHHPSFIPGIAPASPPAHWSTGHAEGAASTEHPPLPSPETVHAASRQTDKVHFTFPNCAGENCNKDKV